MNLNLIIEDTDTFISKYMKNYDCSHNYNHAIRVKNTASLIAKNDFNNILNEIDNFEIIISALMHDIGDHKYEKQINEQEIVIKDFLESKIDKNILNNILFIVKNVSLSNELNNTFQIQDEKLLIKLNCVRDADRIDSLGSIGISRYFIYGIRKNNSDMNTIFENIENRTNILIKRIKTEYGKKIAKKKYELIIEFLNDYKNSI